MNIARKTLVLASIATLCFVAAFYAWVIASPIGASPDEDFHQAMLYCAAGETDNCLSDGQRYGHCFSMRPTVPGSCRDYRHFDEPIASKIKINEPLTLYYAVGHFLVSDSLEGTTVNMRVMNSLLAVLMLGLSLALTATRYRPHLFIAIVVAAVPASLFFLSSINPSAWAIISASALMGPFLSLMHYFANKTSNTQVISESNLLQLYRVIFIVIAASLGLGSRYESFLWAPLIILFSTLFVLADDYKRILQRNNLILLTIIIFMLIIGIAFIFSERSSVQPLQLFYNLTDEGISGWVTEKSLNTLLGVLSLTGIPGAELGTHDVPMPPLVSFLVAVSVGGLLLNSIAKSSRSQNLVFLALFLCITTIIVVLWSTKDWDYYQPRYFLPVLFFFLFAAIQSVPLATLRMDRKYWTMVLVPATIAYSTALMTTMLRFIYGVEFQQTRYPLGKEAVLISPSKLFDAVTPVWWLGGPSWLSPFLTWFIGSVCFFTGVMIVWFAILQSKSSPAAESG